MGNKRKKDTLFKCQKRAIKIISKKRHLSHSLPIFQKYRIMPLPCLIEFNVNKFMWQIKAGLAPRTFNQDAWFMEINHDYDLRENLNFNAPCLNFAACKKPKPFNFPDILNSPSNSLKPNHTVKKIRTSCPKIAKSSRTVFTVVLSVSVSIHFVPIWPVK